MCGGENRKQETYLEIIGKESKKVEDEGGMSADQGGGQDKRKGDSENMGRTIIETNDDCRKCPCYITADGNIGETKKTFHLCRAFGAILIVGVNNYNKVLQVDRCDKCKEMEKLLEEGRI